MVLRWHVGAGLKGLLDEEPAGGEPNDFDACEMRSEAVPRERDVFFSRWEVESDQPARSPVASRSSTR